MTERHLILWCKFIHASSHTSAELTSSESFIGYGVLIASATQLANIVTNIKISNALNAFS